MEHQRADRLYLKNNLRGKAMLDQRRHEALSEWRNLMAQATFRVTAEELYDELLRMADAMEREGIITGIEWDNLSAMQGASSRK
jgi:hypothetical protein